MSRKPALPESIALLQLIAAHQQEILNELRSLRATVDRRGQARADDPSKVSALLQAIAAVVDPKRKEICFSVHELLTVPATRDAIRNVVGNLNGRALGNLLKRNEGRDIEGLRLERIEIDRDGVVWVLRVCKPTLNRASSAGLADD